MQKIAESKEPGGGYAAKENACHGEFLETFRTLERFAADSKARFWLVGKNLRKKRNIRGAEDAQLREEDSASK